MLLSLTFLVYCLPAVHMPSRSVCFALRKCFQLWHFHFCANHIGKCVGHGCAGGTIYMRGGTYSLTSTVVIAESNSGTSSATKKLWAYGSEVPIISFAGMAVASSNRGIILDGSYWHFRGLIIESAGDNGMLLSGDNNTIESCIFRKNSDTGLQLSRYNTSYTSISQWPSNNLILSCEVVR